ncbi:MAG: aminomethyl-transferring glycine dehydrogenase subunit GcvPB [Candidatus Goldiibacteriota bacterium]
MKNVFELSVSGRRGFDPGKADENILEGTDKNLLRKEDLVLPELSELDVIRHYMRLGRRNFSVDENFYPLGSCTMKYNPRINEAAASLAGFTSLHPMMSYIDENAVQGALEMIYNLSFLLCEITGMKKITTQPYAGAHGELTGILLMAAYHRKKGNNKKYIIVPDSAHGTNPASAAAAGYEIVSVPVDADGDMDLEAFRAAIGPETAGVMMTVPGTLGVFEKKADQIAELAHEHDAVMYYDGANLNAVLGKIKPGEIGFDIIHINLHKTFAAPHGGGGPGSGVVGVSEKLSDFLPVPEVVKSASGRYGLNFNIKDSIGMIASFFGNFGVLLKSYIYILMLGKEGLIDVSEKAVLNANYIMNRLKPYYDLPYDRTCMHECVFSAKKQAKNGVRALDIAKALTERGIHPPTVYFPLVVDEALMIEPTETESKEEIDIFISAMIEIAELAETDPECIKNAPRGMPITRPDETKAARELKLTCL